MTVSLTGNFLATARCLIFEDATGITWSFNSLTNQLTATATTSAAATSLAGGVAGDLPYQSSGGVTAFLAPGSNGNLLTLSAGLPAWEAVPTWNQNTTGNAATATNVPYSGLTGSVPTWNQNTTGNAATATALVGGAVTSAVAGTGVSVSSATGAVTFTVNQAFSPTWTGAHIFRGGLTYSTASTQASIGQNAGFPGLNFCYSAAGTDLKLWDVLAEGTTLNWRIINDAQSVANNWMTVTRTAATSATVGFSGAVGVNGASPPAQSTGWGTPTGGTVVSNFAAGASPSLLSLSEAVAQIITVLKQVGIFGA